MSSDEGITSIPMGRKVKCYFFGNDLTKISSLGFTTKKPEPVGHLCGAVHEERHFLESGIIFFVFLCILDQLFTIF